MSSTDYLVICGRAFARLMDAAGATLESPLDNSKHIIAQLLWEPQSRRGRIQPKKGSIPRVNPPLRCKLLEIARAL